MKKILLLIISIFVHQTIYAQCDNVQIGKMIKWGLSEDEINEVCEEERKKKNVDEDKIKNNQNNKKSIIKNDSKIKTPINTNINQNYTNYPKFLDGRTNQGNLKSRFINPPKKEGVKYYIEYGRTFYSNYQSKDLSLNQENFSEENNISIGFDIKYDENNLDFISLEYSKNIVNTSYKSRNGAGWSYDLNGNKYLIRYLITENNNNLESQRFSIEYIFSIIDSILMGLSYSNQEYLFKSKNNFQWYNIDNNSSIGMENGIDFHNGSINFNKLSLRMTLELLQNKIDLFYMPEIETKYEYNSKWGGDHPYEYNGEFDLNSNRSIGFYFTFIDEYNNYYFGLSENPFQLENSIYKFIYKGNTLSIGYKNSDLSIPITNHFEINYGNYKTKEPFIGSPRDIFQFDLKLFYEIKKTTLMLAYNFIQIDSKDIEEDDEFYTYTNQYREEQQYTNNLNFGFISYF